MIVFRKGLSIVLILTIMLGIFPFADITPLAPSTAYASITSVSDKITLENVTNPDKPIYLGDSVKLSITAEASPTSNTITYNWECMLAESTVWSSHTSSGGATITLTAGDGCLLNGTKYRCIVSDGDSTETRETDAITVLELPKFTVQPSARTVLEGDPIWSGNYPEVSGGARDYSYTMWQKGGTEDIPPSTPATASMTNSEYYFIVTDANGKTATSDTFKLTVIPKLLVKHTDPTPGTVSVSAGGSVSLKAEFYFSDNGTSNASSVQTGWEESVDGGKTWNTLDASFWSADPANALGSILTLSSVPSTYNNRQYRFYATYSKDNIAQDTRTQTSQPTPWTLSVEYMGIDLSALTPVLYGTVGVEFKAYDVNQYINGNPPPTRFYAADLPEGLTINEKTGIISGTPTVSGTFYPVELSVENDAGDIVKANLRFEIAPSELTPKDRHTVYTPAASGGYTVVSARTAFPDEAISLEAIASAGYVFDHWEFNGVFGAATLTAKTSFTMPNNDVYATAHYRSTSGGGGGSYGGSSGGGSSVSWSGGWSITGSSPMTYYLLGAYQMMQYPTAGRTYSSSGSTSSAGSTGLSGYGVTLKSTTIYSAASKSGGKLGTLRRGEGLKVLGYTGSFARINYNGRTGYISTSDVKTALTNPVKGTVTERLTVYSAMSTNSKYKYSTLDIGAKVSIIGLSGKWVILAGAGGKVLYALSSGIDT